MNLAYGQRRPLQPGTPLQLSDGQQIRGDRVPAAARQRDRRARLRRVGRSAAGRDRACHECTATPRDPASWCLPGSVRPTIGASIASGGSTRATTTSRPSRAMSEAVPEDRCGGRGGRGGRGGASQNVGGTAAQDPRDAAEQSGYAPTYYPGVESVVQARPITVALGAQALDIDFAVLLVKTVQSHGTGHRLRRLGRLDRQRRAVAGRTAGGPAWSWNRFRRPHPVGRSVRDRQRAAGALCSARARRRLGRAPVLASCPSPSQAATSPVSASC